MSLIASSCLISGVTPNILFIVIDSLRADRCFGKKKTANTPIIDSLIKSGIYFENAVSSSDVTGYVLDSIFSGRFPIGCGLTKNKFEKIYSKNSSFLTILKSKGYHIYGYMNKITHSQGFQDLFENNDAVIDSSDNIHNGLADKIVEKITSNSLTQPWFYFLHFMDVHLPCTVPSNLSNLSLSQRYDYNLSAIDSCIGKLLEKIGLSNTIVVLTSDHGEYINPYDTYGGLQDKSSPLGNAIKSSIKKIIPNSFHASIHDQKKSLYSKFRSTQMKTTYEKRMLYLRVGKNRTLFDDIVHVPLLMAGHGIKHSKPVSNQVGTIDIFPTIFNILGFKNSETLIHGKNLLNTIDDKNDSSVPIYIENAVMKTTIENSTSCVGIRTDNFKYFRDLHDSAKNVHLYDLKNDPLEENNIAQNFPDKINEFESILLNLANNSVSKEKPDELSLEEENEIQAELKKLGYI